MVRACETLAIARATFYRHRSGKKEMIASQKPVVVRPPQARSLTEEERRAVVDMLHCERFQDKAPLEVYATLLDEGIYLCSVRTMYRILSQSAEVRERRNLLRHPSYKKPELIATGPNQVWSWDITKLLGPVKWSYYYLYVMLDIYSRYVVGWMLADEDRAALATKLIEESCKKQAVLPGQLTIHSDRASSMKSKPVAWLMAELGVTKSHSRPGVSNDNPFSESQFKTLKYRPEFPDRFGGYEDAMSFCEEFFAWYNQQHRHTGIGLMTPEVVHYGEGEKVRAARQEVLVRAYLKHPERFVHKEPEAPKLPAAVWINPPKEGGLSSRVAH